MIAIGVGCRKGCTAEDIVALVEQTIALLPSGTIPKGLFSLEEKRGEPGLVAAAATLGLPLTYLDRETLAGVAAGSKTYSQKVEAMFGLPSVAETAALAGAGLGAILLVPRRTSPTGACAIAGPLPQASALP